MAMTDPPGRDDPRVRTAANGSHSPESIEDRVRRLESAVEVLQDTAPTDDAVADRVIAKLRAMSQSALPDHGPLALPAAGLLMDENGNVITADSPTGPPPIGAVLTPKAMAAAARGGWFFLQFVVELRLMFKMYFDSRYRLSKTAQFALPTAVALLVGNYFFFATMFAMPVLNLPLVNLLGPILERAVAVVIAMLLYKVLSREVVRYREVLDYLNKYGYR